MDPAILPGPVLGSLAVLIALCYVRRRQRTQQQAALRRVAEVLGFAFEDKAQVLGPQFGKDSWALGLHIVESMMTGSRAGHQVMLLEHRRTGGRYARGNLTIRGGMIPAIRETRAVFPEGAKGLPAFELWPSGDGVLNRIWPAPSAVIGYPDIRFSENDEFSNHYWLEGADQAAVRRAFGSTTLAFFAASHGWVVQSRGGALTIFRYHKRCVPAELPNFLDETLKVLGAFDREVGANEGESTGQK